jgi:hypothetical protein
MEHNALALCARLIKLAGLLSTVTNAPMTGLVSYA